MKSFVAIFLLVVSFPVFSATWQEAFNICESARAGNTGYKCATYTGAQCGNTGQLGWVSRQTVSSTSCLQGSINQYGFSSDPGCSSPHIRDPQGFCVCPSGQVEDGIGGCVVQPPDCSSDQIGLSCGSQICTGSYSPSFSCWLSSSGAPAGCEAGVKDFDGCPLLCPGESMPNQDGTACNDPVCTGAEHLENHSCVPDPTCIGDQVHNSETHQCDEPNCTSGHTLNAETHICEFSGCPAGTVQATYDGSSLVCVKSGQTTTGTQETTISTTGTQSGTTTTNPDGTQTTTTTTSNTSTSNSTISLDTGGLAQESTQAAILGELKKANEGKAFGGTTGGSLYESNEKTYGGILTAFKDRVTVSPIASAGTGFFEINLAGVCPIWTLPQTALTPAIPIDMQCSDMMEGIWPLISAVVIAAASFMAFRWAFL